MRPTMRFTIGHHLRTVAATIVLIATGACANGQLGNVLGSVLGGQQQGGQVSGRVQGVDTRSQRLYLQDQNGQTVTLTYDANTQVVYQNRNYSVTNLENGDQVTARIPSANGGSNGAYYTDLVQVDQSVSTVYGNGSGSQSVQSFQGIVRQIDWQNGVFAVDMGNGLVTVSLPYNPSRDTQSRFQALRNGDSVRFYGVVLNNSRIELRQFY